MRQQITYQSSTEELEFYSPQGRPDALSTSDGTTGGTNPTLWEDDPVTLDPYTDTISNADVGDTLLEVTDTTEAVPDRRYWVRSTASGLGHEVECVDVPDATHIRIAAPLRIALPSGVIEGHRVTRTVTETSSIRRNCRADWNLIYSGKIVRYRQAFDIVALPFTVDELGITEYDLETADTEFGEAADNTGQWRKLIVRAFGDMWRAVEKSRKPDWIKTRDMLRDAVIYRTLFHRFRHDPERYSFYERLYNGALSDTLRSTEAWYTSDEESARSLFPGAGVIYIGDDAIVVGPDDPRAADLDRNEEFYAPNRMLVG